MCASRFGGESHIYMPSIVTSQHHHQTPLAVLISDTRKLSHLYGHLVVAHSPSPRITHQYACTRVRSLPLQNTRKLFAYLVHACRRRRRRCVSVALNTAIDRTDRSRTRLHSSVVWRVVWWRARYVTSPRLRSAHVRACV